MVDDVSIDSLVSDSHCFIFFFFNDTATTEIYTLSLHDALPISKDPWFASRRPESEEVVRCLSASGAPARRKSGSPATLPADRKSTRLNSSHLVISYAVFCLKKKKNITRTVHHEMRVDGHESAAF